MSLAIELAVKILKEYNGGTLLYDLRVARTADLAIKWAKIYLKALGCDIYIDHIDWPEFIREIEPIHAYSTYTDNQEYKRLPINYVPR